MALLQPNFPPYPTLTVSLCSFSLWDVLVLNQIYPPKFVPFANAPLLGGKNGRTAGTKSSTAQSAAAVVVAKLSLQMDRVWCCRVG